MALSVYVAKCNGKMAAAMYLEHYLDSKYNDSFLINCTVR